MNQAWTYDCVSSLPRRTRSPGLDVRLRVFAATTRCPDAKRTSKPAACVPCATSPTTVPTSPQCRSSAAFHFHFGATCVPRCQSLAIRLNGCGSKTRVTCGSAVNIDLQEPSLVRVRHRRASGSMRTMLPMPSGDGSCDRQACHQNTAVKTRPSWRVIPY